MVGLCSNIFMQTKLTTDQRLENLEEEMAGVKEELTGFRIEVGGRFDQMEKRFDDVQDDDEGLSKKLDKILEVVLGKEKNVNDRLTNLEHHRTHPPIVQ